MTGADWGVDLVGDKGAIQTPNCSQRLRYGGPWIGRRARKLGPSGAEGIAHCASANNLEFEVRRSLREGNRHDDISNTTLHDNLMNTFPIPSLQVPRANTLAIYIYFKRSTTVLQDVKLERYTNNESEKPKNGKRANPKL